MSAQAWLANWRKCGNAKCVIKFCSKKLFGGPSLASSVAAIEFYHNPQILPPMWILAKCHIGSRHISTYFDISDDRLITWVARWWFLTLPLMASVTSLTPSGIYLNIFGKYDIRVEICPDRRDRRSCKICASCVNFPRKQRNFLHNLPRTTRFTHTKCDFALKLLKFYTLS